MRIDVALGFQKLTLSERRNLLIIAGASGVGKSALADALSRRLSFRWVDADVLDRLGGSPLPAMDKISMVARLIALESEKVTNIIYSGNCSAANLVELRQLRLFRSIRTIRLYLSDHTFEERYRYRATERGWLCNDLEEQARINQDCRQSGSALDEYSLDAALPAKRLIDLASMIAGTWAPRA